MNRGLNGPYGRYLTAIVFCLPMVAAGQQSDEEAQESVPATEIGQAPVVAPTQLESAPVVPATAVEGAQTAPATAIQGAQTTPATAIQGAQTTPATEVEGAQTAPATELEQAPVVPLTEIEEVVVTGSRIARTPEELAGNLVILDADFIRASGEATLERVLRQLPQNANATAENFGSALNNVPNFTGASTVNLRGLGSESTLVLVDGKRIGHSGALGGVTDISTIPLALVERIEVLLDGASAIYGSDAVGGVINIITRRDYEGAELDLNYNEPADGSYGEWRGSISGGFNAGGTRIRASVSHSEHSGLDGADRDVSLFERSKFPGPQFDIRRCCFPDGSHAPILYRLDGDVLTAPEYRMLSPEDQARATPETHAVLPEGFNENSSVDDITQFAPPNWGVETQAGYHILPVSSSDGVSLSFDRDFNANVSGEFRVRYESRETTYNRGNFVLSGETFSHFRNLSPFTPFGGSVEVRGQRPDLPSPSNLTDSDTLDLGIDLDGSIGDTGWEWEASFGTTTHNADTQSLNSVDRLRLRAGLMSDGVTPRSVISPGETQASCAEKGGSFSFGRCTLMLPPVPAANPFGDLTDYISDALNASSTNEQTRFDALLRGTPWSVPAGDVSVLVGVSTQEIALDSMSQFKIGTSDSPIGDIESFDTEASRSNQAVYVESLVPLIGGERDLSLSLSGRWDSYGAPNVVYTDSATGTAEVASDLPDPGSASTWGTGLVFSPASSVRLRANWQTSFVAPQLNQLLRRTSDRVEAGLSSLLVQLPNGDLDHQDVLVLEGGNPDLLPETADTLNLGLEITPAAAPGLGFKITWNETDYKDRINRTRNTVVDPNNLPRGTNYIPGDPNDPDDDVWTQERRWFNVSSVLRQGVDFEVYYATATPNGDFRVQLWHSRASRYDVIIDPTQDEKISVLEHTEGSTIIGTVPKTSTTAQFTWGYRGLEAGLDVSTRSSTGSTLAGVTNTYEPPTIADLTLSYSFVDGGLVNAPDWAENARLSFTVNNLGDDFGTVQTVSSEGMVLEGAGTNPSPVYGRVFNLSVHMSL